MSNLDGIFVSLTAADANWMGANDQLYLGIVGSAGGREFVLDISSLKKTDKKTVETYSIGPGAAVFGGASSVTIPGRLADIPVSQPDISYVYLRMQAGSDLGAEAAWQLHSAFVYLIGRNSSFRIFSTKGAVTGQSGAQIGLKEIGHSGKFIDSSTSVDEAIGCR